MGFWKQTSLFAYKENLTLENIIPSINFFGEPTPYALVRKGIEKFTRPGDVVLDPGCGNGTTGVIALELKRKAALSDINKLAVRAVESLFADVKTEQVLAAWEEVVAGLDTHSKESDPAWEEFIANPLPEYPAFSRAASKKIERIGELFHDSDLQAMLGIYRGINEVADPAVKEFLQVVFFCSLLEDSQLVLGRHRRAFLLPRDYTAKHPVDIFREIIDLLLAYKQLIREQMARHPKLAPKVEHTSVYNLEYIENESVDYILFHLPVVNGYETSELTALAENLSGDWTDRGQELTIELDYRGRYRLLHNLSRMLNEMERVLKENAHLTLIFSGHYVLLSMMIGVAQGQGWQLVKGEVEMVKGGQKEEYPIMSLTLQKKTQHSVLGALNKMKVETLYDTEEAILRKIDQYLTDHLTATTEDIQQYLIEKYLHDCLIEKPLEALLEENYLYSGRYWLKPSAEQKEELFLKRQKVMRDSFGEFVREMVYNMLQEEQQVMSYDQLLERFLHLKPRMAFHTPYYRLLVEQCERRGVKLHTLVHEYFEAERKDQFETLFSVLRRLVRVDQVFYEVVPGEFVALSEWSTDQLFKIYLELFERAKRRGDLSAIQNLGKKVLEFLKEVEYLDEKKKERLREYIMRSEGV